MRYVVAGIALVAIAGTAESQTLASRIDGARGTVGFEYDTRANVCGDGASILISNDSSPGWTTRSRRSGVHVGRRVSKGDGRCVTGPARVWLRREGAAVTELTLTVGGAPDRAATELGAVPAAEAARWLLDVAPRLEGRAAEDAVMGAEIAAGVTVWRDMLAIARNDRASESARKAAIFWVSQEATIAATAGLDSIVADDDASASVRSDALFYLAQRPNGEGIPPLMRVAETSKSRKLRKDALWYLSQSRDPRALDLFEKLILGR